MYNLRPPQDSINWNLGLILEVSFLLGLGKPNVAKESWTEEELCNLLAKNQIRHWWQHPPKKQKTLEQFIALVTQNEPFASEWKSLFHFAIKNNFAAGLRREAVFGVEVLDKNAVHSVIISKLKHLPFLELADIPAASADATLFKPLPLWFFKLRRLTSATVIALLITFAVFFTYQYATEPKHPFGEVFTKIRLCLENDFEVNPGNKCNVDIRSFSVDEPKIYLSFESIEPLEGRPEIKLQWLRNGELLFEKGRPWIDAFAIDLKYASTHIKMKKFDYLPPEWAEPGRYHVRFYLDGEFVDEAGFHVYESAAISSTHSK